MTDDQRYFIYNAATMIFQSMVAAGNVDTESAVDLAFELYHRLEKRIPRESGELNGDSPVTTR